MQSFSNRSGLSVVYDLIKTIQDNKDRLSEIDGLIGDGDHGVNMNKGFSLCEGKLDREKDDLSSGLKTLGQTLLNEIGGSMGPLYGSLFLGMSRAAKKAEEITKEVFLEMFEKAVFGVKDIGGAKVGDKTLVDVLDPALDAYQKSVTAGADFSAALKAMCDAAKRRARGDHGYDCETRQGKPFGRAVEGRAGCGRHLLLFIALFHGADDDRVNGMNH